MNAGDSSEDEFNLQRSLLLSRIGEEGSGYARYSAAMFFHKQDLLSLDLLEIYRRCCKLDNEDPIALARHENIEVFSQDELQYSKGQL